MKRFLFCCVSILIVLQSFFLTAWAANADTPLIYISGDPDCYPIEYYNADSKEYEGYATVVLKEFSEKYGYEIRYFEPGTADRRKDHYKNAQVDIVSCYQIDNGLPTEAWENGVTFFADKNEYRFLFTSATGETLKKQLREYCGSISREHSNAILTEVASSSRQNRIGRHDIAVGIVLFLTVTALVVVLVILRKKTRPKNTDADTDIITGIGNFIYLDRYYSQHINDKNRSLYSAIYVEAHLKENRDDLNSLLKYMAVELNQRIGESDILARIDNGFFLLKNCSECASTDDWVKTVIETMHGGIKQDTSYSSAYITGGIYELGVHDRDLDKMILMAQQSSRFAQSQGILCSVYSKQVENAIQEVEELKNDLHTAFQNDEFSIYLQFFIDSKTRKILGAESLSRWIHRSKGVLTPGRYITILEEEDRIHELDFTILKKSCDFLEEYYRMGKSPFFLACNFSRNTIMRSDFVETVEKTVKNFDFPRECLLLEVTEYAKISDTETFFKHIEEVKNLGVRIVIDDFGCGFSDLTDIGRGTFDGVKLDKIFIQGEHTKEDDIIMKSLIDLLHNLKMTVISEGIETEEEAERLLKLGCRVIQGYLYYLPMPRNEALRELITGNQ